MTLALYRVGMSVASVTLVAIRLIEVDNSSSVAEGFRVLPTRQSVMSWTMGSKKRSLRFSPSVESASFPGCLREGIVDGLNELREGNYPAARCRDMLPGSMP